MALFTDSFSSARIHNFSVAADTNKERGSLLNLDVEQNYNILDIKHKDCTVGFVSLIGNPFGSCPSTSMMEHIDIVHKAIADITRVKHRNNIGCILVLFSIA